MEKCVVYYEMCEYECCGKGFGEGTLVKWLVSKVEDGNHPEIGNIDYHYEGHKSWENLLFLEGTVESIKYLFKKSDATYDTPFAEGTYVLGFDEMENDYQWSEAEAFIIWLKDCVIKPATQEDNDKVDRW